MALAFRSAPSALCLIRLSAIGDTCHTVPVVRAIQNAWPQTKITWIIGKTEHSLLSGLEGVEFIVVDKGKGLGAYAELRRHLAGRRFPLLLHMHASARANIVSLMVRAPVRLGFDRARARDFQWLFCNERVPATPRQHVMDGLFEFTKALGIERGDLQWEIPVGDAAREFAERHIDGVAPTLLISPCTGQRLRNYRNWSAESYAAVTDYAQECYGARVLLTGGSTATEWEYGQRITASSGSNVTNLIGGTTLKELLALLARATVVLCPDSGPVHMATAVGTPVVGLYATSNRLRTGPYLSQHLVVDKYPEAVEREFHRSVSKIRWGRRVRDPNAMGLITVPDVKAKLDDAFEQRGIEPRGGKGFV